MNYRDENRAAIALIAKAIGALNNDAVFVGGATIGLYADPDIGADTRPTKDVDFFLEITTPHQLETVREQLVQCGFTQSPEDAVLCRFRYADIKVDVMSTTAIGWAPANQWFAEGLPYVFKEPVTDNLQVQLLPLPYLLATKFAAFNDRGKDPRTSHDMEDIVYLLSSNTRWENEIGAAPQQVKDYVTQQMKTISAETMLAHLADTENVKLLYERIAAFVN
ncbi:MAG: nucleotidyl transferase AbiEii/AbiGii toxin family protein [Chitinophagales bacterium]|nr:nucleotidyl transferase AbiEii/AbiGii toxin family protein [Chitinophagales bacterium]